MALVQRRADDRSRPDAGAGLTHIGLRARVAVVARRTGQERARAVDRRAAADRARVARSRTAGAIAADTVDAEAGLARGRIPAWAAVGRLARAAAADTREPRGALGVRQARHVASAGGAAIRCARDHGRVLARAQAIAVFRIDAVSRADGGADGLRPVLGASGIDTRAEAGLAARRRGRRRTIIVRVQAGADEAAGSIAAAALLCRGARLAGEPTLVVAADAVHAPARGTVRCEVAAGARHQLGHAATCGAVVCRRAVRVDGARAEARGRLAAVGRAGLDDRSVTAAAVPGAVALLQVRSRAKRHPAGRSRRLNSTRPVAAAVAGLPARAAARRALVVGIGTPDDVVAHAVRPGSLLCRRARLACSRASRIAANSVHAQPGLACAPARARHSIGSERAARAEVADVADGAVRIGDTRRLADASATKIRCARGRRRYARTSAVAELLGERAANARAAAVGSLSVQLADARSAAEARRPARRRRLDRALVVRIEAAGDGSAYAVDSGALLGGAAGNAEPDARGVTADAVYARAAEALAIVCAGAALLTRRGVDEAGLDPMGLVSLPVVESIVHDQALPAGGGRDCW